MEKRVNRKKEHDRKVMATAISAIDVAIDKVDLFGRTNLFRWPNGREVISFEEHKEVMKVLLYWKRETEVFNQLVIEKEEKGDPTG